MVNTQCVGVSSFQLLAKKIDRGEGTLDQKDTKEIKNDGMKFLYTNADQFVNKRDDLLARIAGDEPDIIMITEVIPKSQKNPIAPALLEIDGYKATFNFEPKSDNLS